MDPEEEKKLLNDIKSDQRKFSLVFDEYYKPIFNYILRRVSDYDPSRDIASETFIKAFLNIASYNWRDVPLSAWLYRIATNEINQYFRKNKYPPSSLNELIDQQAFQLKDFEGYQTEKQAAEHEIQKHSEFNRVRTALKAMDIKYQEVLSLRYFEKKSILEIADILDKKEGTVKSLLSRGLDKLKNKIGSAT